MTIQIFSCLHINQEKILVLPGLFTFYLPLFSLCLLFVYLLFLALS